MIETIAMNTPIHGNEFTLTKSSVPGRKMNHAYLEAPSGSKLPSVSFNRKLYSRENGSSQDFSSLDQAARRDSLN